MLDNFVEKVDYIRWFSGNTTKIPPLSSVEKLSYVEMVKSSSAKIPVTRPEKKKPSQVFSQKGKQHVPGDHFSPNQKQWLIKNHEVAKVNFDNLWIISKLFASNDWGLIHKRLEKIFQTNIVINPLFDENALISFDQGSISDFIGEERKWQAWGISNLNLRNLKNGTIWNIVGHLF